MQFKADLHLHSRFARACSNKTNLQNLEQYARIKGLDLLGTGDFTHPKWFKELSEQLTEDDQGILSSKTGFKFLWSTEISLIYTQGGKGRRVHHVILAPSKEVVQQIIEVLGKKGRLDYDGRPIFGFSSIELVDMMRSISKDIEIIPAHVWTSWFAIFGSKSGFDSVKECFAERTKYIHALETGMSSDPEMNWSISDLDKYQLVSFSDAHSFWPWRIGREATVFEGDITYQNVLKSIRTGNGIKYTIETDPPYGKYHFDGHRNCNVVFDPEKVNMDKKPCPKCGKELTIGVLNRVLELADRKIGFKPNNKPPFVKLIPLHELISSVIGVGIDTKTTWNIYNTLIKAFKTEYNILLDVSKDELSKVIDPKLVDVILRCRSGTLSIQPGYDGHYGIISHPKEPVTPKKPQKRLDQF
tara:strand:- start:4142 stop:5383 length:1242 start_codon:yes stop_codon:yes gene_type:complete